MSVSGRERSRLERWSSERLDDTVCGGFGVRVLECPSQKYHIASQHANEHLIEILWPIDITG